MSTRHRSTVKLDEDLERLLNQLAAEHPYVRPHRLARLALSLGLRQLSAFKPEAVREQMTLPAQQPAAVAAE